MVEWNLCCYFKEIKRFTIRRFTIKRFTIRRFTIKMNPTFEDQFRVALESYPDLSALARYLEPHLSLIKSYTLNAFYHDLRYHKVTYSKYIPLLIYESIKDYRLQRVLEQCMEFMNRLI